MGKTHRAPDKWSIEAKKRGFRARSAFKLIQINKEYPFLGDCHSVVDLCAAPGGWCQVAAEAMPMQSTIIGVDLVAIKPIRGVVTFQEDITTPKCLNTVKKALNKAEADAVLHDGAPNVGQNWSHDAFTQSSLVLSALKLATELLRADGIFITKIFRSSDYDALIYLFNKLFKHVNAMQPAASRSQSAETFVVCRGYCGAKSVDPRFFDLNEVFKQVEQPQRVISVLHKKAPKRERHRDGYDESLGQILFRSIPLSEFVNSEDPIQILSTANELKFDDEKYQNHPATTEDIIEACKDLKILSKADLKALLKWRKIMVTIDKPIEEPKPKTIKEKKELDVNDPAQLNEYIEQVTSKDAKQKRKDERRAKHKQEQQKLKIIRSMEKTAVDMDTYTDDSIFHLTDLKDDDTLNKVLKGDILPSDSDDEIKTFGHVEEDQNNDEYDYEEKLEDEMEAMYRQYKNKREEHEKYLEAHDGVDTNKKGLQLRKAQEQALMDKLVKERVDGNDEQYRELLTKRPGITNSDSESEEEYETTNSLVTKFPAETSVNRFYSNPIFDGIIDKPESIKRKLPSEFDSILNAIDLDADTICRSHKKDSEKTFNVSSTVLEELDKIPKTDKELRHEKRKKQTNQKQTKRQKDIIIAPESELTAEEQNRRKLIKSGMGNSLENEDKSDTIEIVPSKPSYDPLTGSDEHLQALSIGGMMRKKSDAIKFVDSCYNRYAFNDENLPQWFVDDEKMYNRPLMPITKEVYDQIKKKYQDMANTPIGKVAEARARKMRKLDRLRSKARAKMESVYENSDLPGVAKVKEIRKITEAAKALQKKSKVYIVSKKVGISGKQTGSKFKMVDKRMKRDRVMSKMRDKGVKKSRGSKKTRFRKRR